jgi:dTDP-4-amino-4,6-dideoxygalactose transaminase
MSTLWKVQLFELNFDDRERLAAEEVIRSGWLTMGERVIAFEKAFEAFLGNGVSCTAVSSGTAALHMAVLALDIKAGDEVVIPALTFVADANVVLMAGAKPVLSDCKSLDDWNISVEDVARKLTKRTKAVMVLHYGGYPCDIEQVTRLCRERGIALIEDVAHAPGATVNGQVCGTFGEVSAFSFFSNKNLSIGEGGMVVARDQRLHQRLRQLRSHGMSTLTLDRHKGRAITYDVQAPGLNYRMDEIRAAIGTVQLSKLPEVNRRRAQLTDRYRTQLSRSPVRIPFVSLPPSTQSAYHILPALLPDRCDRISVIERLKAKGIQSSIHYPTFWSFSAFQGLFKAEDAPVAGEISRRQLTLPLFPTMRDEHVDLVAVELSAAVS